MQRKQKLVMAFASHTTHTSSLYGQQSVLRRVCVYLPFSCQLEHSTFSLVTLRSSACLFICLFVWSFVHLRHVQHGDECDGMSNSVLHQSHNVAVLEVS